MDYSINLQRESNGPFPYHCFASQFSLLVLFLSLFYSSEEDDGDDDKDDHHDHQASQQDRRSEHFCKQRHFSIKWSRWGRLRSLFFGVIHDFILCIFQHLRQFWSIKTRIKEIWDLSFGGKTRPKCKISNGWETFFFWFDVI